MQLKGGFGHIAILIIALAFVIAFMVYLNMGLNIPVEEKTIPVADEKFKIVDNIYYNTVYGFSVSAPGTDWEVTCVEQIDTLKPQDPGLSMLDNINVMVEMKRKDKDTTIAQVQVGIIDLIQPRTPRSLASQTLNEIILAYEEHLSQVRVMKAVTLTRGGGLTGAYFVIKIPVSKKYPFPIWVVTFLVRNQLAYSIVCGVTEKDYDYFRADFESIIRSFRFI